MASSEDAAGRLALSNIEEIGPATEKRLNEAGFRSIRDLLVRGPVDVAEVTGMEMDKSAEICNKARMMLEELGIIDKSFVTATSLFNKRRDRISSGSNSFDDLLGGGLETKAVTEVYGEFGTGKTQLCHTLCVMVQQDTLVGGLDAKALYIDTENTFRPERIVSISDTRGIDPRKSLENIIVAKAYNSAHQELIIQEAGSVIEDNHVKLILVDSAVAHYRAEFLGRATLSERQQRLNKFMHILVRIAETYDLAVLVTNQIQASPDAYFGDAARPTGGNVVAHTSTYRIYLKRSGKNRIARMVDSPYHAEREIVFTLSERGISDVTESR
ncbi:MAG: DNA repair and recombination protein RadA [Candidatus Nitrososphaera sp. 13_1_40CM_48_12]|nr:MAG: DNA repair and recombination protein RadA [Candidatus Nitrososphaera sp. 13_1_40CM_48_12]